MVVGTVVTNHPSVFRDGERRGLLQALRHTRSVFDLPGDVDTGKLPPHYEVIPSQRVPKKHASPEISNSEACASGDSEAGVPGIGRTSHEAILAVCASPLSAPGRSRDVKAL